MTTHSMKTKLLSLYREAGQDAFSYTVHAATLGDKRFSDRSHPVYLADARNEDDVRNFLSFRTWRQLSEEATASLKNYRKKRLIEITNLTGTGLFVYYENSFYIGLGIVGILQIIPLSDDDISTLVNFGKTNKEA